MRMKAAPAVLLAWLACGVTVQANGIAATQLVVFGDSLSDNGNAFIGSGGVGVPANYAAAVYNGVPVRYFTDGPNTTPATTGPVGLWVDQLAPKLGVPDPAPVLSNPATGTNYAVGSADTGSNGVFFVSDQVAVFGALHNFVAPSGALYTFWAGANDIADGKSPVTAADNIMGNIEALKAAGAQNFVWLNLPPLGETPQALALNKTIPGASAFLNLQSLAFDTEWQNDLTTLHSLRINVVGVNVAQLFLAIQADNAAGCTVSAADPLCFANITSAAQGQNVDPNTFLYWDQQHPTTAADALVADLAFLDIQAVPEPGTGPILTAISLLAAATTIVRRRKKSGASVDELGVS